MIFVRKGKRFNVSKGTIKLVTVKWSNMLHVYS